MAIDAGRRLVGRFLTEFGVVLGVLAFETVTIVLGTGWRRKWTVLGFTLENAGPFEVFRGTGTSAVHLTRIDEIFGLNVIEGSFFRLVFNRKLSGYSKVVLDFYLIFSNQNC